MTGLRPRDYFDDEDMGDSGGAYQPELQEPESEHEPETGPGSGESLIHLSNHIVLGNLRKAWRMKVMWMEMMEMVQGRQVLTPVFEGFWQRDGPL